MKLFIILTLFSYLVTYFLVSIVPFKNIYFFNSFYLFTILSILWLYWYKTYNKRSIIVTYNKIKEFPIIILLFLLIIYAYFMRWSIEPHGMGDANVLWSGKASVIANLYLQNFDFSINNMGWKFPNYPLALPFILGGFSIMIGKYNYLIPIVFTIISTLIFIYIILTQSVRQKGNYHRFIFILLIFIMFLDKNYLFVQSDLCADYPLSIFVGIYCYLFLRRHRKNNYFYIGCTFAIMSSLKNEGILLSLVFIVILIVYKFTGEKVNLTSIFTAYFIFFLPMIVYKINFSLIPNDFESNEGLLSKVIHKNPKIFLDELILVSKYFIEYQFEYQKGILLLFSYFLIVYGDKKQKALLTFYWLLVFIYSLIFLYTSIDIEKHLNSAYHRIIVHIYPILFIALFYNINILQRRINEIIYLINTYRK
jgi:hypothetical protein